MYCHRRVRLMTYLDLGNWQLNVESDSEDFRDMLDKTIDARSNVYKANTNPRSSRPINIQISEGDRFDPSLQISGTDVVSYHLPPIGYLRQIRFDTNEIYISVANRARVTPNELYHLAVLFPVSYLLRNSGFTLAHAGLVAAGDQGILIVGNSGAGKSSLTIALAKSGCQLYSDEHPLLGFHNKQVMGWPFLGIPALVPKMAELFKLCGIPSTWSEWRGKFRPDLSGFNIPAPTETCRISRIIFPRYNAGVRLKCTPLNSLSAFKTLCKDEYLTVNSLHPQEKRRHRFHVELFLALSATTNSYQLEYNEDGLTDLCRGRGLPF